MRNILLAATAIVGFASAAQAGQIISFGQTSPVNDVSITANAAGTQTVISIANANVLIDQLEGATTPPAIAAIMSLTATSTDSAVGVGPALLQHYSGNFCIASGPGCTGTIDLQGTFTDAAFGLATGSQLSVNVSSPPDTLNLSSGVIPSGDLVPPSSFTLSMSNLSALTLDNMTIATDSASFSGVANATPAPEPAGITLMGVGLLGLGFVVSRKRSA